MMTRFGQAQIRFIQNWGPRRAKLVPTRLTTHTSSFEWPACRTGVPADMPYICPDPFGTSRGVLEPVPSPNNVGVLLARFLLWMDRTSKHIGVADERFDSTFRRCSRRFGERQLMEPMKPMTRMAPMGAAERWWPDNMGSPSTSGSQNGMRYAFFRDKRRLMVERDGHLTTYETGDHDIGGVSQAERHRSHRRQNR